jgi:hypothetical protein
MWNGLENLLELQKLDIHIARVRAESQAIPGVVEGLEVKLAAARTRLDETKTRLEQIQKERRVKERELDEASLNTKKKQARLFEIKTNEEYSAVLKEIESLKERSSKLEEHIIGLLEQGDVATKAVTAAEKEFTAVETLYRKERTEKEALFVTLQQELTALQESRKRQASRIESALLQQYIRLVKTRGVAVVAVKDGSCSGCGIALTPQTYSEVRRNERMLTCASCNRILYFAG